MRIAILYAPGDEVLAETRRTAVGAHEALIAPLASPSLAYGDHLVLLVLWTHSASAYELGILRLADQRGGVVVWRADATPLPSTLERVGLDSGASPRAVASALRLAEMELERAPEQPGERGRRGGKAIAVAGGVAAALAIGAAGAAAFMLDGQDPVSLLAQREVLIAPSADELRPTIDDPAL